MFTSNFLSFREFNAFMTLEVLYGMSRATQPSFLWLRWHATGVNRVTHTQARLRSQRQAGGRR
ncbi:hypothetical protein [Leptolyngbya iicbica]|uniref:Uncharacterized protein n=2 Tax=Cyanophyceae TaxID=3028117 RepID=A0A4Q7EK53_9CYAN|nr:hypothetical protein DYY88_02730 [Leptolyngbya sp. LK]